MSAAPDLQPRRPNPFTGNLPGPTPRETLARIVKERVWTVSGLLLGEVTAREVAASIIEALPEAVYPDLMFYETRRVSLRLRLTR